MRIFTPKQTAKKLGLTYGQLNSLIYTCNIVPEKWRYVKGTGCPLALYNNRQISVLKEKRDKLIKKSKTKIG